MEEEMTSDDDPDVNILKMKGTFNLLKEKKQFETFKGRRMTDGKFIKAKTKG